jgi:hypothetical protein
MRALLSAALLSLAADAAMAQEYPIRIPSPRLDRRRHDSDAR